MDFPQAQTPPAAPARARVNAAAAVLALALYAFLLARNVGAVAGGSDSSGYMNHARLLASGGVHVQPRTIPGLPQREAAAFLYVPLGFEPAPNGNGLVPTYPVGFSLFVLALKPLVGWRYAGDATIILSSIAGLAATYALGRRLGLGRAWATLGSAIVAASPLYLFMSIQAMSDVPSLAWTTLAVVAALKCRERPSWALAAGAAVAFDVLLRPTNVLVFIPVAVALGTAPRRWILFLVGGLPGAVFFFAHSLAAYGSLAATGYGDASEAFGLRYVPGTLVHYALWIPALFTPVAVLVAGLPWLRSVAARTRWLLLSWILAFAAFYCAYKCTHETWWYLRFLLPAVPAVVVGALLVLRALFTGVAAQRAPAAAAAAIALLIAWSGGFNHSLHPLEVGNTEHRYEDLADWMERNVPHDAVCLTMQASGALFYYTQFTFIRWDVIDRGNVGRIESAVRESRRPLYAVLFPFEYDGSHLPASRMPGRWRQVGSVADIVILRRDFDAPGS
jgi:hypothetical protein